MGQGVVSKRTHETLPLEVFRTWLLTLELQKGLGSS